jgi:hypothetical protein
MYYVLCIMLLVACDAKNYSVVVRSVHTGRIMKHLKHSCACGGSHSNPRRAYAGVQHGVAEVHLEHLDPGSVQHARYQKQKDQPTGVEEHTFRSPSWTQSNRIREMPCSRLAHPKPETMHEWAQKPLMTLGQHRRSGNTPHGQGDAVEEMVFDSSPCVASPCATSLHNTDAPPKRSHAPGHVHGPTAPVAHSASSQPSPHAAQAHHGCRPSAGTLHTRAPKRPARGRCSRLTGLQSSVPARAHACKPVQSKDASASNGRLKGPQVSRFTAQGTHPAAPPAPRHTIPSAHLDLTAVPKLPQKECQNGKPEGKSAVNVAEALGRVPAVGGLKPRPAAGHTQKRTQVGRKRPPSGATSRRNVDQCTAATLQAHHRCAGPSCVTLFELLAIVPAATWLNTKDRAWHTCGKDHMPFNQFRPTLKLGLQESKKKALGSHRANTRQGRGKPAAHADTYTPTPEPSHLRQWIHCLWASWHMPHCIQPL